MSSDDDSVFAQLVALEEEERGILKQTKDADKKTRHLEDKMRETDVRMIKAEERLRKASIEAAAYVPSTTGSNPAAESELKACRDRVTRAQEKATKAEETLVETEAKLKGTEEAVAAAKQQHATIATRNLSSEIAATKQKVNSALDDALKSQVGRAELKQKIEAWEAAHEHLKHENSVAAHQEKLERTHRELAHIEAEVQLAEDRAAAHERSADIAAKQSPEIAEIALRRALDELSAKKTDLEKQRKDEEARLAAEAIERARKAEEDKRREAEEKARKEAEERARRELEEKLRREEQARIEREAAELKARREAEERARVQRDAEEAQAQQRAKEKEEKQAREAAERRAATDRDSALATPATPVPRKDLDLSRKSTSGGMTPPPAVSPRPEDGGSAATPPAEEFSTRSRSSTGSRIRRTGPLQVGSITFTDIEKVKEEIANSLRPEISFSWFVVSYTGPTAISFTAAGQSSLSELADQLRDDQVQYAILRLSTPTATTKVRDILLLWFGPNVKLMEKTKKRAHVGDIKRILQPVHCELTVLSKKNFNEKAIIERTAIGAFPELE